MLALLPALLLAAGPAAPDASALREADRALARAVESRDRAAFEALVDEDAIFGERLTEGRAAIGAAWSRFMTEDGPRLRWEPESATLAASGDLGFTVGRFRLERKGASGAPEAHEGRYVTVWRRGADGRFRALFDLSLEPALATSGALERTPRRATTSAAGDLEATIGTWTRRGAPGPASGAFLVVRRRGPGGALDEAVSTVVAHRP